MGQEQSIMLANDLGISGVVTCALCHTIPPKSTEKKEF